MVSNGQIILLECKCVESKLRVLPSDIVFVNCRKCKKCMIRGSVGMCSLQDQLAPEFPMIGTCNLGDGDSAKEVEGSSFLVANEWTESRIRYRTLRCTTCNALMRKRDRIVALAAGRCASSAIWPGLVAFYSSD